MQQLETLCCSFGVELSTACIAYIHSLENIEQVIIGSASLDNLKANIDSTNYDLDKKDKKVINIVPYNNIDNIISFHCGPFLGKGKIYYDIDLGVIFNSIHIHIYNYSKYILY